MATKTTEPEFLDGLIFPFDGDLDPLTARALLRIRFSRETMLLINRLLRKNQRGVITSEERIALEKYIRTGKFIDVLQAKARRALSSIREATLSASTA